MWYMPTNIAELIACVIFLYMKIFVCLIIQARLLAIISKFGGGGVDNSILWLSFAQQKVANEKEVGENSANPVALGRRFIRSRSENYFFFKVDCRARWRLPQPFKKNVRLNFFSPLLRRRISLRWHASKLEEKFAKLYRESSLRLLNLQLQRQRCSRLERFSM
jgi:hypothetical protein